MLGTTGTFCDAVAVCWAVESSAVSTHEDQLTYSIFLCRSQNKFLNNTIRILICFVSLAKIYRKCDKGRILHSTFSTLAANVFNRIGILETLRVANYRLLEI